MVTSTSLRTSPFHDRPICNGAYYSTVVSLPIHRVTFLIYFLIVLSWLSVYNPFLPSHNHLHIMGQIESSASNLPGADHLPPNPPLTTQHPPPSPPTVRNTASHPPPSSPVSKRVLGQRRRRERERAGGQRPLPPTLLRRLSHCSPPPPPPVPNGPNAPSSPAPSAMSKRHAGQRRRQQRQRSLLSDNVQLNVPNQCQQRVVGVLDESVSLHGQYYHWWIMTDYCYMTIVAAH